MRLARPLTLLGASGLLCAAIVYEGFAPSDPVVIDTPTPVRRMSPLVLPPVFAPPPPDSFADIDARPLFSADRKPLADSGKPGPTGAPTDFALTGIISGGDRAVALLRSKSLSTTTSAVVGGVVNGWRVTRIGPTSVTLNANGTDVVLALEGPADRPPSAPLEPPPTNTPAAPAPVAPAAPPPPSAPLPSTPAPQAAAIPAPPAVAPRPAPPRPTIAPEALKGAYIDPKTGEPTL